MPDLPNVIQWSIPIYLAAILVEIALGARYGLAKYQTHDTMASLSMAVGTLVIGTLTGFAEIGLLGAVQQRWGLFDWGWGISAFVVCFVLDDLRKYWLHRAQHRCRWFWAAHVTHHSSKHYNFSTALRNPPTIELTLPFLFRLPLALLGFPIEMIVFVAGIDSVYQFLTHTETVKRLPWLVELVLVTPSHHRVHHATNARYLDANYGSVFIVWDRLFGTFVPESSEEPCRYGLTSDLGTFNPVRIALHEWVAMFRDVTQREITLSQRLRYLLAPPGYSHDGSRETTELRRARLARNLGQ